MRSLWCWSFNPIEKCDSNEIDFIWWEKIDSHYAYTTYVIWKVVVSILICMFRATRSIAPYCEVNQHSELEWLRFDMWHEHVIDRLLYETWMFENFAFQSEITRDKKQDTHTHIHTQEKKQIKVINQSDLDTIDGIGKYWIESKLWWTFGIRNHYAR